MVDAHRTWRSELALLGPAAVLAFLIFNLSLLMALPAKTSLENASGVVTVVERQSLSGADLMQGIAGFVSLPFLAMMTLAARRGSLRGVLTACAAAAAVALLLSWFYSLAILLFGVYCAYRVRGAEEG